jgi:hypothetical protein
MGEISIGTPPQTLKGKYFFSCIILIYIYPDLRHSPIQHWFSVGTFVRLLQLFLFKSTQRYVGAADWL